VEGVRKKCDGSVGETSHRAHPGPSTVSLTSSIPPSLQAPTSASLTRIPYPSVSIPHVHSTLSLKGRKLTTPPKIPLPLPRPSTRSTPPPRNPHPLPHSGGTYPPPPPRSRAPPRQRPHCCLRSSRGYGGRTRESCFLGCACRRCC